MRQKNKQEDEVPISTGAINDDTDGETTNYASGCLEINVISSCLRGNLDGRIAG